MNNLSDLQKRWWDDAFYIELHNKVLINLISSMKTFEKANRRIISKINEYDRLDDWYAFWNLKKLVYSSDITENLVDIDQSGYKDLRGICLQKKTSEKYKYDMSYIRGVTLADCDLSESMPGRMLNLDSYYKGCLMNRINFESAMVSGFYENCSLSECDFERTVMTFSTFNNCNILKSNFKKIKSSRIYFQKSKITDCNFSNAEFISSTFSDTIFENCNFGKSNLYSSRQINCKFINCSFNKVDSEDLEKFMAN